MRMMIIPESDAGNPIVVSSKIPNRAGLLEFLGQIIPLTCPAKTKTSFQIISMQLKFALYIS